MLTTDDFTTLNDYEFKSSPESYSNGSYYSDSTDLPSDEDFLQQLSSDLDIPLLLNQGEDELNLLNSFFDKSPDEIMSEIALPYNDDKLDDIAEQLSDLQQLDLAQWGPDAFPNLQPDIKSEPSSSSSSDKSPSPVQEPQHLIDIKVKDEVKSEPLSPGSCNGVGGAPIQNQNCNKLGKVTLKRVAIQPKTPYSLPQTNNKVVVIKNSDLKINPFNIKPPPPKMMLLESIPITTISQVGKFSSTMTTSCPAMVIKDSFNINNNNVDARILKRQQRKIKNRESACLSRKKKKDYLTSLENEVKDLTVENQKLKLENSQLKERLYLYEGIGCAPRNNLIGKNVKNSVIVCMFLLAIGLNFNFVRNPLIGKNRVEIIESDTSKVAEHYGRNLLWASNEESSENKSTFKFSPFTMCPAYINQTESARLVLELERWIGRPKGPKDIESARIKSVKVAKSRLLKRRKARKYETKVLQSVYSMTNEIQKSHGGDNKEIQVFSPSPDQLYNEFFEAINRQDDTFYVVSFSDHHMLLPALHHNKTRRPKMSLIMPSVLPNGNATHSTLVPLMQIDCEVLDTRLIQVSPGSIPKHLRAQGNATSYDSNDEKEVKPASSDTQNYTKKAYKPYFVKDVENSNLIH